MASNPKATPEHGVGHVLAVTAIVSIPLALVAGAGYLLFMGGKSVRKRLWQTAESEEEIAARLEKAHRDFEGLR